MRFWFTLIIGLFLVILGYSYLDQPITSWCSSLHIEKTAKALSWIIAPEVHLTGWPIIFFLLFYLLGVPKGRTLLFFVCSVAISIFAIDILKVLFGRARPEEWLNEGIYGFFWLGGNQKYLSFPSGHAATIGAVMGSLACLHPRLTILWSLIAFCLSTCRLFSLDHFFSDIVCSLMISFLLTQKIYEVMNERRSIKIA